MGDEHPAAPPLASVKSPKSFASPNVAIVINSTVLKRLGVQPNGNNPLTELPSAAEPLEQTALTSPKSAELPCVDIVKY